MKVTDLGLSGVKLIEPIYFDDNRGYSAETYNEGIWNYNAILCRL